MNYRQQDAREAERAIREYWRALANSRGAVDAHSIQEENRLLREQLAAMHSRRAVRWAERVKSMRPRHSAQPEAEQSPVAAGPAFSILMTVYNKGALVQRAIESVYAQTLPDWELLIWDDGSTDPETLRILEGEHGPNTRLFRSENRGVIAARNALGQQAKGQFLIFLDADDELRPTYLEKALLTFTRFPAVDIVVPSVKMLSDSSEVPPFWMPAHFEERRLAYENTTPISSAIRVEAWRELGGMSEAMETGYEDWEFWRRCAHAGRQGWVLDDALFLYRHSISVGRDAEQRTRYDANVRDIKQIIPLIAHPARPIDPRPGAVSEELRRRVFHVPRDQRRSVVVFVPWLLVGGGADRFLKTALSHLAQDMHVTVIGTEPVPAGHLSDVNEFLEITPYVYHLPGLMDQADYSAMVQSLLYRLTEPAIVNMGSPWAYHNLPEIRGWTRGFGPVVDIQFNHIGHLAELLDAACNVDQILVSNARLQSLLVEYFEVPVPVDVMYVAPPELPGPLAPTPPRDRPRIGWLGRNSAEKRPDLVAEIAAAAPGVDFVIAGGGFSDAPALPNLEVVGFVEDSLDFLNSLDLLLNTSDAEGISVSAMEALQVGVPVATRDVGGMTELIQDGHNGFVYRHDDVRGLVERFMDPELLRAVQETAQAERLPARFHEKAMVEVLRHAVTRKVQRA